MKIKTFLWSMLILLACSVVATSCDDDDAVAVDPETEVNPEKPEPQPEPLKPLTFKFENLRLDAYTIEVKITPSDEVQAYYADLVLAADIAELDDKQLFAKYAEVLRWNDVLYGEQVVSSGKTLDPQTEYVLVTFGITKHEASTPLTRYAVSTTEEVGPSLEITPSITDGHYQFQCRCTSGDAVFAMILAMEEEQYNLLYEDYGNDMDIAAAMFDYGSWLPEEWMPEFNGEAGVPLDMGEAFYDVDMIALLDACNEDRVHTVVKAVAPGPKRPDPHTGAIEGTLKVSATEPYTAIIDLRCTTKNADDASLAILNALDLEKALDAGDSIEQVVDAIRESMTKFNPSWMEAMNSDQGVNKQIEAVAIAPNATWAVMVELKNIDSRTILRDDLLYADDGFIQYQTEEEFRKNIWDFDSTYTWNYKGDKPCVIDFFATWCGPCKAMLPTLNILSAEFAGKVDFYQVDIERCPEIFEAVHIATNTSADGIPFFAFVDANGEIEGHLGLMSEFLMREKVQSLLDVAPKATPRALRPVAFSFTDPKDGPFVALQPAQKRGTVVKLPCHFLK